MQLFATSVAADRPRSRNWLMDVLVVLGVLGFGYFAVMLESAPQAPAAQHLLP